VAWLSWDSVSRARSQKTKTMLLSIRLQNKEYMNNGYS